MKEEVMGWICKCGHNRSFHRREWNPFRGEWNTSCRQENLGISYRAECRCGKFAETENGA